MEIQVGEYIRTNKDNIGQVIGIFDSHCTAKYHIEFQGNVKVKRQYLSTKTIIKHSKNITDLIEVGDILEVYFPIREKTIKVFADEYFKDSSILDGIIRKAVILKTILTKEQYSQNCYRLED